MINKSKLSLKNLQQFVLILLFQFLINYYYYINVIKYYKIRRTIFE